VLDPGDLHRPLDILMNETGLIRLSRRGECAKKKAEQAQPTTNLNYPSTIDHMKDALCKVIPQCFNGCPNFLLHVIPKRSKIVMFYLKLGSEEC